MATTKFDGPREDEPAGAKKTKLEVVQQLADEGNPESQTLVGHAYYDSDDFIEAQKWYLKAAMQGHVEAQGSLGDFYRYGPEESQDFEEAVKWYMKAAEQGDPYGQTALGHMYYNGFGVAQDHEEAVKWYKLAADQGNCEAQYGLGWAYEFGEGCQIDSDRAANFYRKASEQGHSEAQFRLGLMHYLGTIRQDYVAAEKWFRLAAEQGMGEAQTMLGAMLVGGEGTQQNVPEAVKWLDSAAAQGEHSAQTLLGQIYKDGEGVPKDLKRAADLLRQAAEQDDPDGQYLLGQMVLYGLGMPPDSAEALEWFRKAGSSGQSDAAESAKHMESVERELERRGITYESRKQRIARLLLLIPRFVDGNWPWMDEKPLSKKNANKFFLYAILDYRMNVKQVYQNVETFVDKTLQDPPDFWDHIARFSQQEWEEKFRKKEVFLHRYPAGHMRVWHIGKDIVEKYHGDAREIWKNQSPDQVLARLKSLGRGKQGIGNKLSAMTMGALFDSGQLLTHEGSNPLDVKVDMHVKKVLGRALRGAAFKDSEAIEVLKETRQMYPPIPYLLDQALYYLGKETCHKVDPDCDNCYLRTECAFNESAMNR